MLRAIELSRRNVAACAGGPFGAVVVKDGVVIGEGANAVTRRNDPTAHAEVEAIRAACARIGSFDLSGAVIYASCEPCPMCLAAIYWARIGQIYFANTTADAAEIDFDDRFIERELRKDRASRTVPMTQLMRDDALQAFRDWRESTGKVRY
jgi:tRNA(Arg) A34 adenosine deaminase TadA